MGVNSSSFNSSIDNDDYNTEFDRCMLAESSRDQCHGSVSCFRVCKHISDSQLPSELNQYINDNIDLYPGLKLVSTNDGKTKTQVRNENRRRRRRHKKQTTRSCGSGPGNSRFKLNQQDILCPNAQADTKYTRSNYYHITFCQHHMNIFRTQFNSKGGVNPVEKKHKDTESLKKIFNTVTEQWNKLHKLFESSSSTDVRAVAQAMKAVGGPLVQKILAHLLYLCAVSLGNIAVANLVRLLRTYLSPIGTLGQIDMDATGVVATTTVLNKEAPIPLECTLLQLYRQNMAPMPAKFFVWLCKKGRSSPIRTESTLEPNSIPSISPTAPTAPTETFWEQFIQKFPLMNAKLKTASFMDTLSKASAPDSNDVSGFKNFMDTMITTTSAKNSGGDVGVVATEPLSVSAAAMASLVLEQAMIKAEVLLNGWLDLFVTGCALDPTQQYSTSRNVLSEEDIVTINRALNVRFKVPFAGGSVSLLRNLKRVVENVIPQLQPEEVDLWKNCFNQIHSLN